MDHDGSTGPGRGRSPVGTSSRAGLVAALAAFSLSPACTAPERAAGDGVEPFGAEVSRWALEVDAVPGAEPLVGPLGRVPDPWTLALDNLAALAARPGVSIEVPGSLEDVGPLEGLPGAEYRVSDILDLSAASRDLPGSSEVATFHVLFLDGVYRDEAGPRPDVLGLSIDGASVIAVFSPAVAAAAGRADGLRAFVEQTTLVHELGHAVGLVDDGLPATSDHADRAHPAHCARQDCVMYHAYEGAADLVEFARTLLATGRTVILCEACLADAAAAAAR